MPISRTLLVEPCPVFRAHLKAAAQPFSQVDACADFHAARALLLTQSYAWLMTHLHLGAYNGLHLVHLTANAHPPVQSLVYADVLDPVLTRHAYDLGAFVELRTRMPEMVASYLRAENRGISPGTDDNRSS